jgi:hypothetical protein
MNKNHLARQLRLRLLATYGRPRPGIALHSDDKIIECFLRCPECDKRMIREHPIEPFVSDASSYVEFLERTGGGCGAEGRGFLDDAAWSAYLPREVRAEDTPFERGRSLITGSWFGSSRFSERAAAFPSRRV